MACKICNHTMKAIGRMASFRVFWCSRCGTTKTEWAVDLSVDWEISFDAGEKYDVGVNKIHEQGVEKDTEGLHAVGEEFTQLVEERDPQFAKEYRTTAAIGKSDTFGGFESRRVYAEWIEAERPSEIAGFIRERANK